MAAQECSNGLEDLRVEAARYREGLVARNTVLAYLSDFRIFQRFCATYNLSAIPATGDTLSLYLTYSLRLGRKVTTCRRHKAAILYEHRSLGLPLPDTSGAEAVLHGAQRIRAEKPRQMKPLHVAELRRLSTLLFEDGSRTAMRARAMLVMGFATALRRSSIAALTVADIEFVQQGMIVSVQREKCDQSGRGRLIGVVHGKHRHTDPVRVMRDWLEARGADPGPLFPRFTHPRKGQPLDGQGVWRIVKRSLRKLGIESQRGPHSLRAGAVTTLGERDVGILRIGAYTSQSADTVAQYFRHHGIWKHNVSRSLGL